jgi:type II secretion system protein C
MVRYGVWLANTALFVICCSLVADTANAIITAWLTQSPTASVESDPGLRSQNRTWAERQVIVDRNLFHSGELSAKAPEPEPIDEELEETSLPLKLWGTIASQNPELAWASVEMLNTRETGAFQVGDPIDSATLVGIERRRVVLLENGSRRGLSLDDEMPAAVPKRPDNRRNPRSAAARSRPRTRAATRRPSSARRKQEVVQRVEIEPEEVQAAIDNPASIYSQARILPQLADDGSIAGLQISGIQPGSVFEQAGILEGEVITEINGVAIGDGDATQILSALTDQGEVPVKVRGEDGDRSVMVAAP